MNIKITLPLGVNHINIAILVSVSCRGVLALPIHVCVGVLQNKIELFP